MTSEWKAGDWVIYNLSVGQIKEIRNDGMASFSDGSFETSGMLQEWFRPLTLRNKAIIENFEIYLNRLRDIDGEQGFNHPDIKAHFVGLALRAIDDVREANGCYSEAESFVADARNYKPLIQGVKLFRPKR